jgi:hypothetical protein
VPPIIAHLRAHRRRQPSRPSSLATLAPCSGTAQFAHPRPDRDCGVSTFPRPRPKSV